MPSRHSQTVVVFHPLLGSYEIAFDASSMGWPYTTWFNGHKATEPAVQPSGAKTKARVMSSGFRLLKINFP